MTRPSDMEAAERSARDRLLRALGWEGVDPDLSIFMYGLVSVQASALLATIEQMLGVPPPDDLLITHPSVSELARFVAELEATTDFATGVGVPTTEPPKPALDWIGEVPLHSGAGCGGFFIRRARLDDTAALAALEELSWPLPLRGFSFEEIEARIRRFEPGQFVLCDPAIDIVGSLYTQRIASTAQLGSVATFREALAIHDDAGPVWQLLSVQILPSLASRGLGDMLINYALTVARATAGVNRVIAVTRCRTWAEAARQQPSLTLENHIGMGVDPGLVFHTARGADITAFVDGWRPEDVDNSGVGILVEYDLPSFRLVHDKPQAATKQTLVATSNVVGPPAATTSNGEPPPQERSLLDGAHVQQQAQLQRRIGELVEAYLEKDVSVDAPLMDAGIDSYLMQNFVHVRL